jgi:hypothetical protein
VASLTADDLDALAAARLQDADALLTAGRYEGARYVCGYAIELKLKARICRAHGWNAYPPLPELNAALKTHNFNVLLLLSTLEATILRDYSSFWAVVTLWSPELRYNVAPAPAQDAHDMIEATRLLLAVL